MEKQLANIEAVQVKADRVSKSGRKLKAVFGRWDGDALVTDAGRLVSRKELGAVTGKTKGELTDAHAKAVARFNVLGEACLASEQSAVAKGTREMKRMFFNPKTERMIIETASADKAMKVSKILKEQGVGSEVMEKILTALKLA